MEIKQLHSLEYVQVREQGPNRLHRFQTLEAKVISVTRLHLHRAAAILLETKNCHNVVQFLNCLICNSQVRLEIQCYVPCTEKDA